MWLIAFRGTRANLWEFKSDHHEYKKAQTSITKAFLDEEWKKLSQNDIAWTNCLIFFLAFVLKVICLTFPQSYKSCVFSVYYYFSRKAVVWDVTQRSPGERYVTLVMTELVNTDSYAKIQSTSCWWLLEIISLCSRSYSCKTTSWYAGNVVIVERRSTSFTRSTTTRDFNKKETKIHE